MAEEMKLTERQRLLKEAFNALMQAEDENDVRTVLVSLLEDAKKKRRKDVTIEAPVARMEIRTE